MSTDLPDWIDDRLKFDPNLKIQQRDVARILVQGGRPYYGLKLLEAELDVHRDTIRERLDEMEELDVVRKERVNKGEVYWINHDGSEWPIPPDIGDVSSTDEMTVSKFFSQKYIILLSVGVLLSIFAGPIIWVGTLQSANYLSLPVSTEFILAGGLSTIFVSMLFIFGGILFWILSMGSVFEEIESLFEGNI